MGSTPLPRDGSALLQALRTVPASQATLHVAQHFACAITAVRTSDPSTWVRPCATQIQALDRGAVVGESAHGAEEEQLVRRHVPVEVVPASEREPTLEIERRQDLTMQHRA